MIWQNNNNDDSSNDDDEVNNNNNYYYYKNNDNVINNNVKVKSTVSVKLCNSIKIVIRNSRRSSKRAKRGRA